MHESFARLWRNTASMPSRLLVCVAVWCWLLAACGQTTPPPSPSSAPPTAVATSATPTVITVVPTPSAADKAVVTGILETNPSQPNPAAGLILYLADVLPDSRGTPFLGAFDRAHSIRSVTDSKGRFVFADVPPTKYALVLDRIRQAFLLGDPKKPGTDFTFTPQGGKLLDLGNLVYAVLPGG